MNIVSHIIYPMAIAEAANIHQLQKEKASFFNWKQLLLIGLFGGLPDILSPHFMLQSRYASLTHSVWFFFIIMPLAFILGRRFRRSRTMVFFCVLAVLLHVVCDMIAGGINLIGPFGKVIIGRYYIPARVFVPFDVAGILFFSLLLVSNLRPVRTRPFVLISCIVVALYGSWLAFAHLDTETFFLKRMSASEIDSKQLDKARRISEALFKKWQAGTFEPLSNEFTEDIRQVMTPQWQKSFFNDHVKGSFGDYKGITFSEAITARFYYPQILLYRFKGSFTRMSQTPEIGISFDSNGKVTDFRWTPKFSDRILNY